VLGGVADDGQQDQTDESLTDTGGGDDGVNAVDEVFGADGDEDGDEDEANGGGDGSEDFGLAAGVALRVFSAFSVCVVLSLGVEEFGMRFQLEE